jgi:HEAT repeat protein
LFGSALKEFGHEAKAAVPALIKLMKAGGRSDFLAAGALGAVDANGDSIPALVEALRLGDDNVRRFAAFSVRDIGPKAAAAAEALQKGMRDDDEGARIAAAEAYWVITGKADEAVEVLRSALKSGERWTVQMWAADALQTLGPAAKAAVPELIECLASEHHYVIADSAEALGKIGADAASAESALSETLANADDDFVRVCIAQALWRINRSESALPIVRAILAESPDSMAISQAARSVAEMPDQADEWKPLLRAKLKHTNRFVREAAAETLKQLEQ